MPAALLPSEFHLTRFAVWRTGVATLLGAAAAVLGVWWQAGAQRPPVAWIAALGAAAAIAMAAGAAGRMRPILLRHVAGEWFVVPESGTPRGPYRLDVPIDLGPWMLLRLRPSVSRSGPRPVWVPAQRRGHEGEWHALRRAVYSPRPSAGGPPEAQPHLPE